VRKKEEELEDKKKKKNWKLGKVFRVSNFCFFLNLILIKERLV